MRFVTNSKRERRLQFLAHFLTLKAYLQTNNCQHQMRIVLAFHFVIKIIFN
jgi:hypothetical protein